MIIRSKTVAVKTKTSEALIDISSLVSSFVKESGVEEGYANVFIPHTTAAVTINENADPDVCDDMLLGLRKICPNKTEFKHAEGNSDAHIKSSIIGCNQMVIIENGRLVLGTWQGIYLCEFDGPRNRNVIIQVMGE